MFYYNIFICSSSVTTVPVPDHDHGSVLADPIPADTDDTGAEPDLTAAAACHHLLMAIPTVYIFQLFLYMYI